MEPRLFHGKISPRDFAKALMGEFNRGNYRAQVFGNESHMVVQISTMEWIRSGGRTALSVTLKQIADGVNIHIGEQAWMGVAASLGKTLLFAWKNPWNIIGRLDDLAQDIDSIQLSDKVWNIIESTALTANATYELSEKLRRLECTYCGSANPVGEAACLACGAPLGKVQPSTCRFCGYVLSPGDRICNNCGKSQ
jgi:hypothetical protein